MPSKSKKEADAWLLEGEPVSGVLAWDRSPTLAEAPRPSPGVRAAAVALVSKGLSLVRFARVQAVETLLVELEVAERGPVAKPKRKHG